MKRDELAKVLAEHDITVFDPEANTWRCECGSPLPGGYMAAKRTHWADMILVWFEARTIEEWGVKALIDDEVFDGGDEKFTEEEARDHVERYKADTTLYRRRVTAWEEA